MKTLSSEQIQVVINSLYSSIEVYSKLAAQSLASGNYRLYEQFLKQEKNARNLLKEIE